MKIKVYLAPEIQGFIHSVFRKIPSAFKEPGDAVFLQNTMPPSLMYGKVTPLESQRGDFTHIFKHSKEDIYFKPGAISSKGMVFPISMAPPLIHLIRSTLLPGGNPLPDTAKDFLGSDPEVSNVAILVLPLPLFGTGTTTEAGSIIASIQGKLGISVLLVESEPHSVYHPASILQEGHRFATEILNNRVRTNFPPIVILPSKKTMETLIQGLVSSSGERRNLLKGLYTATLEKETNAHWVIADAKSNLSIGPATGYSSSGRCKVIGVSKPFVHNSVSLMTIRVRPVTNVTYPVDKHWVRVPGYETILDPTIVVPMLKERGISDKKIQQFLRQIPTTTICYSDAYYYGSLSYIFGAVRDITASPEEACALMEDLCKDTLVLCGRKVYKDDFPTPPPSTDSILNSRTLRNGQLVFYGDSNYIVIGSDPVAGLALILPHSSTTVISDRILVPYTYLFADKAKTIKYSILVPGEGTSEYLTISTIKRNTKGKDKTEIVLTDIAILERCVFMNENAPCWTSMDNRIQLYRHTSKWELHVDDKVFTPDGTLQGWQGEYGTETEKGVYLVGERHGSIVNGIRGYLKDTTKPLESMNNVLFSGRPEILIEPRPYHALRMGILSILADSKHRVILHSLSPSGTTDPQLAPITFLNGFLGKTLRYLVDDMGIQEVQNALETLPMVRLQSLTPTPVFETEEEQKAYKQPVSNPDVKMRQFITFLATTDQLWNLGWNSWARGGPPLFRPPNYVSGVEGVRDIAKHIIERGKRELYKDIQPKHVAWAVRYAFHRLRAGVLVSIRGNAIRCFFPFVKVNFQNPYDRDNEFWFGKDTTQRQFLTLKNKVLTEMGMRPETFAPRKNWFVNNSLVGNMVSEGMNDIFTLIGYHMLQETLRHHTVGDCDFILNVRDFPKLRMDGNDPDHALYGMMADQDTPRMPGYEMPDKKTIPFFGFNTHPNYADIPIVDPDTWVSANGGYFGTKSGTPSKPSEEYVSEKIWNDRKPMAVFRGSATGYGSGADVNQRLMLAEMFDGDTKYTDIAITSGAVRDRKTDERGMRYLTPKSIADKVPGAVATTQISIRSDAKMPLTTSKENYESTGGLTAQDQYRMVIYIDGNAGAYRYTSLMRAGFTILRMESLVGYEMWMYPSLKEALPGSNEETFNSLTDEEIIKLYREKGKDGDHILFDKEGKTLERIIRWAQSGKEATDITREIARNAMEKYKTMCSKKKLMSLMALTMNVTSLQQHWTNPHRATKVDIQEPRESMSLVRQLNRMNQMEMELETIEKKIPEPSEEDKIDTMTQFVRPPMPQETITDEKTLTTNQDQLASLLESLPSPPPAPSAPSAPAPGITKPKGRARARGHAAMEFLLRKIAPSVEREDDTMSVDTLV